ncbi:MAG: 3'(2'),5'-bisphosphate nucleotidase CysQ [Paracoccaceae bacterium]
MAPDLTTDPAEDTRLLLDAAVTAGEIAMKHFRTDVETFRKGDDSPVTAADLEINEMLAARLPQSRPGYGWLSEETEDSAARLSADHVFIIDPIDGTRSFIAGEEGFSIAMAVARRGRVTSAVVHLPAREETFAATLGAGATKNGALIAASLVQDPAQATVLTARKQMEPDHWLGGVPPMTRHFRSSLAWRMCLVAEGRFDTMLTFRDAWEWDIAAGALIASEAGALVTNGQGGVLDFNAPGAQQPGVIAAPSDLHARLLSHRLGS